MPNDTWELLEGHLRDEFKWRLTTEYGCEKGLGAFSRDSDASPSCLPFVCPDGRLRISKVSRAAINVPPHIKYTCRSATCSCDESYKTSMEWDSNDLKLETLARHETLPIQLQKSSVWQE